MTPEDLLPLLRMLHQVKAGMLSNRATLATLLARAEGISEEEAFQRIEDDAAVRLEQSLLRMEDIDPGFAAGLSDQPPVDPEPGEPDEDTPEPR